MIGLVVGKMALENIHLSVYRMGQAGLLAEGVESADPAAADGASLLARLVVDIGGRHDRSIVVRIVIACQSFLDISLASAQYFVIFLVHLKTPSLVR